LPVVVLLCINMCDCGGVFPCVITDLSVLLNKLNEGFIALAAQLQVSHEAVKVFAAQKIFFVMSSVSIIIADCKLFY